MRKQNIVRAKVQVSDHATNQMTGTVRLRLCNRLRAQVDMVILVAVSSELRIGFRDGAIAAYRPPRKQKS